MDFDRFSLSSSPTLLVFIALMARRKICTKCGLEFTDAQYRIHTLSHLHDQDLQKAPADLPTSRLLPIEVPEEDVIMTEDTLQPIDWDHVPGDNPFTDHHKPTTSCNPFDDHAAVDDLSHNTPFPNTLHPLSPPVPDSEDMDITSSSSHSGDGSEQPASIQPSLSDEDIEFEDSGLDPAFTGSLSLSEQLKENFLRDYHGQGGLY